MSDRICPDCEKSTNLDICPDCGARTINQAPFRHHQDSLIGKLVNDRYQVLEVLGSGGMGKVYVAEQVAMKRQVALKVISVQGSGEVAQKMAVYKRFQREALASSRLEHHNTVRVFDFGISEDGTLFLAMELLRGRTLTKIMHEGPMPARRIIQIAKQLCNSLSEAHEKGIIHRDLKPDNIMVFDTAGQKDFVKVLDFGIAKIADVTGESSITRTGLIMGTPAYMAPEQASSGGVGPGTDLYALGVILYEALTGRPPFTGQTPLAVLLKHVNSPVPPLVVDGFPPDVPPGLIDIVFRLLEKDPSDRPTSALELASLLEHVQFDASPAQHETKPVGAPAEATTEKYGVVDIVPGHSGPVEPVRHHEVSEARFDGQDSVLVGGQDSGLDEFMDVAAAVDSFPVRAVRFMNRHRLIALVLVAVLSVGTVAAIIMVNHDGAALQEPATVEAGPAIVADVPDVRADEAGVQIEVVESRDGSKESDVERSADLQSGNVVVAPTQSRGAVSGSSKAEVRRRSAKSSLPRCERSKCPLDGDCVDGNGRRVNGIYFCGDIAF